MQAVARVRLPPATTILSFRRSFFVAFAMKIGAAPATAQLFSGGAASRSWPTEIIDKLR